MKRHNNYFISFFLISILFSGCLDLAQPQARLIDTIIIKNSTNTYIQKVSVSKDFSLTRTKTGSISPVLANSEQVYGRPTRAKRIPNNFQVKWITADQQTFTQTVSVKKLLEKAAKNYAKTMVIDFETQTHINTYLLK